MDESESKPRFAWQPLTPHGVGAFAEAPFGRVLLVQFIVALLASATVVWFVRFSWFPVVRTAIGRLPVQGQIVNGRLDWHAESPITLAEGKYLAFTVDLKHKADLRSPADVQVEFGEKNFRVISLFGFLQRSYSPAWRLGFNRDELGPWWGAWSPAILAIVAVSVGFGLLLTWAALGSLYSVAVWLIAFFADRKLSFWGSWRVAAAALMPGALLLTTGILLYGLGTLDLVGLLAAVAIHWVLGWFYGVGGALCAPRHPVDQGLKQNPFI